MNDLSVIEEQEPILFSVTKETIDAMRAKYLHLTVSDVSDKEGLKRVHAARMDCVKARTTIDKTRKQINEDALATQRRNNALAKELTELIEPIEKHLESQERWVESEQSRLRKIEDDAKYASRRQRLDAADPKSVLPEDSIRRMSDTEFDASIIVATASRIQRETSEKAAAELEAKRQADLAEQAEKNRIAAEKLAAERAEFEKQRLADQAERDRLQAIEDKKKATEQAERDAHEAELRRQREELQALQDRFEAQARASEEAEREKQRQQEEAQRLLEIEERMLREAQERIKREAEEQATREAAEEAERVRIENLRPDIDKLQSFAETVESLILPTLSTESESVLALVKDILDRAAEEIRELARDL